MGNERFSRRGTPPTEFEQRLVEQTHDIDNAWLEIGQALMREHGNAGLSALVTVLDTLGTEKVHVPCREEFFRRLWRPVRDAQILELLGREGETITSIAHAVHVSEGRVRQISRRASKRSGRRYRGKRVCSKA